MPNIPPIRATQPTTRPSTAPILGYYPQIFDHTRNALQFTNNNNTISSPSQEQISHLEERIKKLELSLDSILNQSDRGNPSPSYTYNTDNNSPINISRKKRRSHPSKIIRETGSREGIETIQFQQPTDSTSTPLNFNHYFNEEANDSDNQQKEENHIDNNNLSDITADNQLDLTTLRDNPLVLTPSSAEFLRQLSSTPNHVKTPFPDWKQYIKGGNQQHTPLHSHNKEESSSDLDQHPLDSPLFINRNKNRLPYNNDLTTTPLHSNGLSTPLSQQKISFHTPNFNSPFWTTRTPTADTPYSYNNNSKTNNNTKTSI